eukprot:gnl/TRDRNA2_/TRDRNA2_146701_c1_seq1.p1 gnl/TRDRNA2_/TRDRNA2_146701_c1~~gnl/TRDRNA2_/TRDRNA2_146701_c1_seq1.p1  ORF type:complete len:134 (+),score=6.63 gnl/TRDRNA2_/TRDRNA2_146701_c1_seq1:609-1010(+)
MRASSVRHDAEMSLLWTFGRESRTVTAELFSFRLLILAQITKAESCTHHTSLGRYSTIATGFHFMPPWSVVVTLRAIWHLIMDASHSSASPVKAHLSLPFLRVSAFVLEPSDPSPQMIGFGVIAFHMLMMKAV